MMNTADEMWNRATIVAKDLLKIKEHFLKFGIELSYNQLIEVYDELKRIEKNP